MKFTNYLLLLLVFNQLSAQYALVWSDEFDGNSINTSNWTFDIGTGTNGWGNNELEYYRQENASVSNGLLHITAKQESFGGMGYTSTRMKTLGKVSVGPYGKIEARIKLPSFTGSWPAFWMMGNSGGWPQCGEIDIMEHINTESQTHAAMHWEDNSNSLASYSGSVPNDVSQWHVYSLEWNEEYLIWSLDGNEYFRADIGNNVNGTDEFHNSFYILLNLAIGGNWPGFSIDENALPATLYVDYVRVYQSPSPDDDQDFSMTIEAEDYANMSGIQTESCSEGGLNVGYIDAGDWLAYSNITFPATGTYTFEYRVASLNGGGRLSLDLNAGSIVLGETDIPNTGDWQSWVTISHNVYITKGTYNLGIYAVNSGWNIDRIKIQYGAQSAKDAISGTEIPVKDDVSLFPNPVTDNVVLSGNINSEKFMIYNETGQLLRSGRLNSESAKNTVEVSSLNPGIYYLVLQDNTTFSFTKK